MRGIQVDLREPLLKYAINSLTPIDDQILNMSGRRIKPSDRQAAAQPAAVSPPTLPASLGK